MQQIPNELRTAIKRGYDVHGKPLVIAEWNFNSFIKTTVSNTLDADNIWPYNKEYFPLKSISESMRPKTGIFYAFSDISSTTSIATSTLDTQRAYALDLDNYFKYWVSPVPSEDYDIGLSTHDGPIGEFSISRVKPQVEYESFVKANKIKIVFNLGALPKRWYIEVFDQVSSAWTQVGSEETIDLITGACYLWWNGTTWTTTQQLNSSVYRSIKGVRILVETIDKPGSRVEVLEIAAGREIDITERVESYDIEINMDEEDFIHPVGTISANSANLRLNDFDLKLSDKDITADFYGMLNVWCQFRFYTDFDLSNYAGAASFKMRIGTMYTNEWQQTNEYSYNIVLFDILKLLQGIYCPAMLIENESIARTISRILDMSGVDQYEFQSDDFDDTAKVKYFWTNGEETVYEVLKRLCESHQCAVFCDELGNIQLITRKDITNEVDTPDWTFLAENDGLDISDVVSLDKQYDLTANDVTIQYKKMEAKIDDLDLTRQPLTTSVWQADETITLRANSIKREIASSGLEIIDPITGPENNSIWVNPDEAALWPYKGLINVDGEVFEYSGKGYFRWDFNTNTRSEMVAMTDEERRDFDKYTWNTYPGGGIDPTRQNGFSGRLVIRKRNIDGRGEKAHSPNIDINWKPMHLWLTTKESDHWPNYYFEWGATYSVPGNWKTKTNWSSAQYKWSWKDSILSCDHVSEGGSDWRLVACNMHQFDNSEMREFGTRIRFKKSWGHAGIIINPSSANGYDPNDPGIASPTEANKCYMLNILTTETANKLGRGWQDEIFMELKLNDELWPLRSMRTTEKRGVKWQIDPDKWYDVEVIFTEDVWFGGQHCVGFEVFINGQYVDTFYDPYRLRATNWSGLFVRGPSFVDFDYFYATNTIDGRFNYDDAKFTTSTIQLAPGSNKTEIINIPLGAGWSGKSTFSLSTTSSNATVHSLKFVEDPGYGLPKKYKNAGPFTLTPDARPFWELEYWWQYVSMIVINYTSTNNLSACIECTQIRNMRYEESWYNAPNDYAIYDLIQGGYVSDKLSSIILTTPSGVPHNIWGFDEYGKAYLRRYFHDEFGSIAHEMRKFEVTLDKLPAKGVKVYLSNNRIKVVDQQYHPTKGIFTLINASRKTEIVNGTEEIDESNSIDHSLMLYGYVLEEKGDMQKNVKDEDSIRKRGPIKMNLDAPWIHSETEAEELGKWITDHWADPMDVFELEVFSNTFSQIGDKIDIKYSNSGIEDDWLFVISRIKRSFNEDGLSSSLTVRRVR